MTFLLFYVLRFLIQPLLILSLTPAFYYQENIKKPTLESAF
ncbi:exosortase F system-associated protein [Mesonia sp. JHPTF-M18]|uniref:Exosortase F system-associated protein n=1 Tax=Mesonia aestuariivivens TaxID=2796128 RepID=A0ABS6W597_9FLAO|nr:exosortase F system-associated protein [Mesonia aestuariivivens]